MRHRKADKRLGRRSAHREALVAALVCGLVLIVQMIEVRIEDRDRERLEARAELLAIELATDGQHRIADDLGLEPTGRISPQEAIVGIHGAGGRGLLRIRCRTGLLINA